MNIFVIGGAGYIGSHVVREFLDRGHQCMVYDNFYSGLRMNLYPQAGFTHGDILDFPALKAAMAARKYDALIHLAAFKAAGESMLQPEKYARNNIIGTLNILNAAVETGITRVVFSSSAAVYGEPEYLPIDEAHSLNPENFYGFTKLEIERFLAWYEKLRGVSFASLRYFNAAGYDINGRMKGLEQNPANLLPVIMEAACGMRPEIQIFGDDYDTPDGTCIRDYIHVNDLATAHAAALDYIMAAGKSLTVNLGSETGVSVYQVLESARSITGMAIPSITVARRPGDPAKLTASSARARELLGWSARCSDIETIIRTSWEVYKEHR
jgi:UDP-glucose 4-epimerase